MKITLRRLRSIIRESLEDDAKRMLTFASEYIDMVHQVEHGGKEEGTAYDRIKQIEMYVEVCSDDGWLYKIVNFNDDGVQGEAKEKVVDFFGEATAAIARLNEKDQARIAEIAKFDPTYPDLIAQLRDAEKRLQALFGRVLQHTGGDDEEDTLVAKDQAFNDVPEDLKARYKSTYSEFQSLKKSVERIEKKYGR